jgi:hypothetical protein
MFDLRCCKFTIPYIRSPTMLRFYCYTKEEYEIMKSNYLSSFIKKTAYDYKKTNSRFFHTRRCLRYMVCFGNWLKKKRISIKNVCYDHVDKFLADVFPHLLGKISYQKTAARKAIALILSGDAVI